MSEEKVDQEEAGTEVSSLLPCVEHKTGALHSIVCWGKTLLLSPVLEQQE